MAYGWRWPVRANDMMSIGMAMQYIGGFGPLARNGKMLAEHAEIALSWVHEIEGAQG